MIVPTKTITIIAISSEQHTPSFQKWPYNIIFEASLCRHVILPVSSREEYIYSWNLLPTPMAYIHSFVFFCSTHTILFLNNWETNRSGQVGFRHVRVCSTHSHDMRACDIWRYRVRIRCILYLDTIFFARSWEKCDAYLAVDKLCSLHPAVPPHCEQKPFSLKSNKNYFLFHSCCS